MAHAGLRLHDRQTPFVLMDLTTPDRARICLLAGDSMLCCLVALNRLESPEIL